MRAVGRSEGLYHRYRRYRRVVVPGPALGLAAALMCLLPAGPAAHELQTDVVIRAFFKPEGQRLRLLARVPLEAMADIEWPMQDAFRLDLTRAEPFLRDASTRWVGDNIEVYEGDTRLEYPRVVEVRASLISDQSFLSYEQALAHVTSPRLPDDTEFVKNQGLLDVLFEYSIQSSQSRFSITPTFGRLGVPIVTMLRFLPPDGAERAFEFRGDPGLVRLNPRWHQAAWRFVGSGFLHLLNGLDHLLFLLCLVVPFRRLHALVPIVISFTVAHSITLIASTYDMAPDALWFSPLVQTLIAVSIVYTALENVVTPGLARRWLIAFAFGLVHGFGFWFALRDTLQFAGSHLLTSVLAFNVGVEIGQLLVLVLVIPALELLFRFVVVERIGTIVLSVLVTHTAWHWMREYVSQLSLYTFRLPAFDTAFFAGALRWLILLVIVAGAAWLIFGVFRQPAEQTSPTSKTKAAV